MNYKNLFNKKKKILGFNIRPITLIVLFGVLIYFIVVPFIK